MNHKYVELCGFTAMMLVRPAFAQTKIVLDDADSGRVFEGNGAITQGGREVTRVKYEGYLKRKIGMAYLLSSCDPNCSDNLSVTP